MRVFFCENKMIFGQGSKPPTDKYCSVCLSEFKKTNFMALGGELANNFMLSPSCRSAISVKD